MANFAKSDDDGKLLEGQWREPDNSWVSDGDVDPSVARISPCTFRKMAEGASRQDEGHPPKLEMPMVGIAFLSLASVAPAE
jgi:hypothetical protein